MPGEPEDLEVSDLAETLDTALTALQSSLAQAGESVTTIRTHIAQVGILVDMVREMEAAITLARQSLSTRSDLEWRAPQPALQVVSPQEDTDDPGQPVSTPASNVPSSELDPKTRGAETAPAAVEPAIPESAAASDGMTASAGAATAQAPEPTAPPAAQTEPELRTAQPAEAAAPVGDRVAAASEADTAPDEPAAAPVELETKAAQPAEMTASETATAPDEPAAAPAEPETESNEQVVASPAPQTPDEGAPAASAQPDPHRPISRRLRMGVSSNAGSLDLRAVDGAVNENPAVVDVALLDYDGRRATLKLWISGTADPQTVRESLIASLRDRLGDEQETEVNVDLEQAA